MQHVASFGLLLPGQACCLPLASATWGLCHTRPSQRQAPRVERPPAMRLTALPAATWGAGVGWFNARVADGRLHPASTAQTARQGEREGCSAGLASSLVRCGWAPPSCKRSADSKAGVKAAKAV
eukprot:183170-Chlamydomonas_euryale.AAC.2